MDHWSEWLETDGLGGYASGTVSGIRTRRYHAALIAAMTPPTGRMALVQGVEAWITTPRGRFALASHRYASDVIHPDGAQRLASFERDPWPTWSFLLEDGTRVQHELFLRHGLPVACLSWKALGRKAGVRLEVRPLLSGRDAHHLHRENAAFGFAPESAGAARVWRSYPGVPGVIVRADAEYRHEPEWYRGFLYSEERDRGLDAVEDLASPGVYSWDLSSGEAALMFAVDGPETRALLADGAAARVLGRLRTAERRRRDFPSALERAADAYIVTRGAGRTIVAGYPWFTDWGRDTFVAMRGLCTATGRHDDARRIAGAWSERISEGMLPNAFGEHGEALEYHSVDASLWYVVATYELIRAFESRGERLPVRERARLVQSIGVILDAHRRGTRFGIRMDSDGLLACGEPGVQLTWMDAKVGDWVVTPRTGKPVEVQALWLNALQMGRELGLAKLPSPELGIASFHQRFWNDDAGGLHDVVDVDHRPGVVDSAFRPNQLLAVGGLPFPILEGARAKRLVDEVERRLWTPLGPRTLAPGEPAYAARYEGGPRERDAAYHQGTVWPWLAGAFVEAWVRVYGGTPDAKRQARRRFLEPLFRHLDLAGLGHVSEIADADAPHAPRGGPFQAWSLGELLRLDRVVLAGDVAPRIATRSATPATKPVAGRSEVEEPAA